MHREAHTWGIRANVMEQIFLIELGRGKKHQYQDLQSETELQGKKRGEDSCKT